jgi:nitrogenase molybdenum-iron protein alpha/beta subunit
MSFAIIGDHCTKDTDQAARGDQLDLLGMVPDRTGKQQNSTKNGPHFFSVWRDSTVIYHGYDGFTIFARDMDMVINAPVWNQISQDYGAAIWYVPTQRVANCGDPADDKYCDLAPLPRWTLLS